MFCYWFTGFITSRVVHCRARRTSIQLGWARCNDSVAYVSDVLLRNASPEYFAKKTLGAPGSFQFRFRDYFGITSRANLLATTSRISLRFFPASIMASREP